MLDAAYSHPRRTLWFTFGLGVTTLVAFSSLQFLGPILVGVFMYYAARPAYRRIRLLFGDGTVAATVSLLFFVLPVVGLLAYTGSVVLREVVSLLASYEPSQLNNLLGSDAKTLGLQLQSITFEDLRRTASSVNAKQLLSTATTSKNLSTIGSIWESILSSVTLVSGIVLKGFIAFIVAFYLLRDDKRLSDKLTTLADNRGTWAEYARAVDQDLGAIFFGNLLNAFVAAILGVIVYSGLSFIAPESLSVSYPALLGLLTGVASLIPTVGMKLVYVPYTIYLTGRAAITGQTDSLWFPAVFFLAAFVIIDTIADLFLRPYVSGKNIHIGALMLAYIFGPIIFGWYGLFLGPLLLVLFVHFVDIVLPELLSPTE